MEIELPDAIKKQLCVIDQSMAYILLVIGAVILSYYSVSIQRKQLICSVTQDECCKCLPDIFPIKCTSSIMIIISVCFFFNIAKENCEQQQTDPAICNSAEINYGASLFVLIAAAMRFYDLIKVESSKLPEQVKTAEESNDAIL